MAEVKRSLIGKPPVAGASKKLIVPKAALRLKDPELETLTLPDQLSEPSHNINDYHFLIHGEKKIGKTTLAMAEPGTFLLTFDPFQKSYPLYQRFIPKWIHLKKYLTMLQDRAAKGTYPYSRVVLDGVDTMYRLCRKKACIDLGVDHPSEAGWSQGWDKIKDEFSEVIDGMMALPGGAWFICHSQWKDINKRKGADPIMKLMPQMPNAADDILVGKVDGWFAYDYDGSNRVLIVRGDQSTGAGCRVKNHFMTPKGRVVKEIHMGSSEEEAWSNLQRAFNNQQTYTTLQELENARKGGAKPILVSKTS